MKQFSKSEDFHFISYNHFLDAIVCEEILNHTLRKFIVGYRLQSESNMNDMSLHSGFEADLKCTTETPVDLFFNVKKGTPIRWKYWLK